MTLVNSCIKEINVLDNESMIKSWNCLKKKNN